MSVKIKQKNPGWLKRLLLKYKDGSEIAVGFPVGSASSALSYPNGEKVVDVAASNEFGIGVPERSFLRTGGREFVEESTALFKKAVKRINDGNSDLDSESNKIGAKATAFVQQKIVSVSEPPNAESTIRIKGSSNPLVDTGLMKQSVTWEVR